MEAEPAKILKAASQVVPQTEYSGWDISEIAQDPVMTAWLIHHAATSDQGILSAVKAIRHDLDTQPVFDLFLWQETIRDPANPYTFDRFLLQICQGIEQDIILNQGEEFRHLIRQTDETALAQILGNENLRDWLFGQSDLFTIYDLEIAAVKALILYSATVLTDRYNHYESSII